MTINTDSRPVPKPKPACDRCKGTEHLIVGDGPTVCFGCIALLTGAAADPGSVSPRLRDVLRELHSDIVRLGEADHGAQAWEWTGWK